VEAVSPEVVEVEAEVARGKSPKYIRVLIQLYYAAMGLSDNLVPPFSNARKMVLSL
jgi:hypothetical protein